MIADAVDRAVAAVLRDPRSDPAVGSEPGSAGRPVGSVPRDPGSDPAAAGRAAGSVPRDPGSDPGAGSEPAAAGRAAASVPRDPGSDPGAGSDPAAAGQTSAAPEAGRAVTRGSAPPSQVGDPSQGDLAEVARRLAGDAAQDGDFLRAARAAARRWPGILLDGDLLVGAPQDDRLAGLPAGPLARIPVAVKDNIDVAGLVTGMGGPTGRHTPRRDADAVRLLREAGALIVGHTAMRELAWGVTTPGCPNPWRAGLDTGGSSGGSAAAVASGIAPIALGTDTGGSIRIPAALCGVTGLRPTHGLAPMGGITAMTPDLDVVGPLGRSAGDCLLVHEILAGPGDPAPRSTDGLAVGMLAGWRGRVHRAVQEAVDGAADALRSAGVRIVPIDLGSAGLVACVAYVLMLIESARLHLADAERHAGTVDPEVLEQLRQGARIGADAALYPRARALADAIGAQVRAAMADADVAAVLGPVTAVPAVPAGAPSVEAGGRSMTVSDALSRYTALASVTGLPALSLPAGLADGLPVGVQLMGRARGERTLALLAGPIERGPGAAVAAARRRATGA